MAQEDFHRDYKTLIFCDNLSDSCEFSDSLSDPCIGSASKYIGIEV